MALSIRCQACAAEFSLAEELFERRVAGKVTRFKCVACEQLSTINASNDERPAPLQADSEIKGEISDKEFDAAADQISEIADDEVASLPPDSLPVLNRPPPRPRLESKVDDELWVVNVKEGAEDQEIFESSLVDQIAVGKIPSDAIVWKEGMKGWSALANVPELAKHVLRPPAPKVADDKTGGLFGTGLEASFGTTSGDRKSAPPPLPPKKRSYGSANKKSQGQKSGGKPVALSPGFLFSVDDARSEPPEALAEPSPKGPKAVPKPPLRATRRAVTRDLDFSDIEGEEVPLSGTPALKDLTVVAEKHAPRALDTGSSLASLGAAEEDVLGPPSIDISDIGGTPRQGPPAEEGPAPVESEPAPSSARSEAPVSKGNKKRKPKKARSSKRPSLQPVASAAPAQKAASKRPARIDSERAPPRDEKARAGWFTPGRALMLVAIAGLTYFLFSRQSQPSATETTASEPDTVPAEAQQQAPAPTPKPPAKASDAPGEPDPSGPNEEEQADEPEPVKLNRAPQAPAAPQPVAKPPAGEAQPEAKEAKQPLEAKAAPKKQAPPPPSNQDAPPFNRTAAVNALNTVVAQASGCRQPGDPTGTARVVLTFAPSGRVTSANLSGPPFAGTRTGGCIAATMRRATVPAFSGSHVTVSKSVVIR